MARDITFWFDFASPYAWIAFDAARRVAEEAGCGLELRPILLWAVLRDQNISAPMEAPARRAYMLADMRRSADFTKVPLRLPEPFQISTHQAARLWYGLAGIRPERAAEIARTILEHRFVQGADLRDPGVLRSIAATEGISAAGADAMIAATGNRNALAAAIAAAAGAGVIGVPFFMLGSEGFFGADRLGQLRWRLGLPPA